jgi:hypothetical protein
MATIGHGDISPPPPSLSQAPEMAFVTVAEIIIGMAMFALLVAQVPCLLC